MWRSASWYRLWYNTLGLDGLPHVCSLPQCPFCGATGQWYESCFTRCGSCHAGSVRLKRWIRSQVDSARYQIAEVHS